MTTPVRRPAVGDGAAGWSRALLRGFLVFLPIAGIGLGAAIVSFAIAGPGVSFAGALRIGALYLGPFHHVALVIRGDLAVDVSRLPGSGAPAGASTTVEIGVALLAVTALAAWLLFRAGRASAIGDGAVVRALSGARVALGYAPPVLLAALLVRFEEPVELGSFVTGVVRISMSVWQALVFPLAIAALAGASGGLWSWVAAASDRRAAVLTRAVLGGGWRMFLIGLGLAYLGLFVAGIVQPDAPVATATPSTARYFATVFERPGRGAVILGHHLAVSPNEAMWTLVPVTGACDVVRGSEQANILCYGRFPLRIAPDGAVTFGGAPWGYLAFLVVPAVATVVGGRWAASSRERAGWSGAGIGAASGVAFAASVFAGCLLASVTLSYGAAAGASGGAQGHLWIGPDPVLGTLFALAWGVLGGALGGACAGIMVPRAGRRPAGRSAMH
ncbi:MAG: hypothetical protein WB297_10325 [Actinomycetota bacterium]